MSSVFPVEVLEFRDGEGAEEEEEERHEEDPHANHQVQRHHPHRYDNWLYHIGHSTFNSASGTRVALIYHKSYI